MSRLSQTRRRVAAAASSLTVSRGLTVLAILVLLLIVAVTTQQLVNLRTAVLADTDRQLTRLDMVFAEQTGRAVETVDFILRNAIETLQTARRAPPVDDTLIDATLRRRADGVRQLIAVALTDAGGKIMFSSKADATADLGAAALRAVAFHAANPEAGLHISEPLRLPDQAWTVLLTRRISAPGGGLDGIAVALLNLAYFQDFFRSVELDEKGAIVLHHRDGTVLTRYPAADAAIGTSFAALPPFKDVLSKALFGSILMISPVDGSVRLVAIRALRAFPLAVNISVDVDQMLAGWRRQTLIFLTGATAAGLSTGGLLLMLARRSRENERLVVQHQRAKEEAERANIGLREQIAERERAEAALNQAQRIEAVGQLTGGVAHDFNNLLTILLGNIDLLERSLPPQGRTATRLASMRTAAERGATLTRQLLAFARRQKLVPCAVNLNAVITGMDGLLRSALGSHIIQMEHRLEPALWQAMVDPAQIELVILNLAINAREAMPAGGTLAIETGNLTIAARNSPTELATGEPGPGDYVVIAVRDTGDGMTPEILAKVFEPFFTTKPPGAGSGLGLSQVLGTAQQLGGGVRIESAPQAGTTVRVYLPRAATDAGARPRTTNLGQPGAAAREGHATILVVDDDAAVRRTVAELLTGLGYHVHVAENGGEALEKLRSTPEIDVLLTDVVMPVMSGPALAREALRMRPALPIVFMSGYANPHELAGGTGEAALERLVHKPFRHSQLAEQLDAALALRAS
jgi:signal transduction histidine kinase